MKKIVLLFVIIVGTIFAQGSREGDSLAFLAILEANPGNTFGWDYSQPLDEWNGVVLKDGRVDSLTLFLENTTVLPTEIGNLTQLTYLNLSANTLTNLPAEIGYLTNLEELVLNNCHLMALPSEIGNLIRLKKLNLFYNYLTTLPPEIGNLTSLIKLELTSNYLTSLPSEIGNLTSLTELYVENNSLVTLPPEFGSLTNLTELYLQSNSIEILPPEFGNLTNLTELYLQSNSIEILPSEFGNLTSLTYLSLEENSLTILPAEIGNLTSLNYLYLQKNYLMDLPKEISALTPTINAEVTYNALVEERLHELTIKWLDLYDPGWRNTQIEITDNTIKLTLLEIFDVNTGTGYVNWDRYTDLTTWDGVTYDESIKNVTGLNIRGKSLKQIPASISDLNRITVLDISDNCLTELPEKISQLPPLELDISDNYLLESELSQTVITWLDTCDPDWRDTQKEITDLNVKRNLLKIKAANPITNLNWNLFTNIQTWHGITYNAVLKDITELNLKGEKLTIIPRSIGNLTELTVIDISDNMINSLPEEIITLNPINGLDVSNTNISINDMKDDMIAWLDTYDSDWRDTQGEVAIAETNPTAPKSFSVTMGIKKLNFSTPLSNGSKLSIFTLNGKEIMTEQVSGASASIPSLAKGIYVVRISSEKINSVFKMSVQ